MRIATLISWLLTVSLGVYMLRTWIVRGGLRRERARAGGLPPQLIFGHAGLALTGLLTWAVYSATRLTALAWLAVAVLTATIGLGICTVTLWTPYPARGQPERAGETGGSVWDQAIVVPDSPAPAASPARSAEPDDGDQDAFKITDEMIAELLADPFPAARHREFRPPMTALVPVAHGFAAMTTFILAVMTASRV